MRSRVSALHTPLDPLSYTVQMKYYPTRFAQPLQTAVLDSGHADHTFVSVSNLPSKTGNHAVFRVADPP